MANDAANIATVTASAETKTKNKTKSHDRILILDFGAQYTRLIARALRELHVYCEIFPWDVGFARIAKFAPRGIILSGGPASAFASTRAAPREIFEMQLPLLGICYGMQTMIAQLGGEVAVAARGEYGRARLEICADGKLLGARGGARDVWMRAIFMACSFTRK